MHLHCPSCQVDIPNGPSPCSCSTTTQRRTSGTRRPRRAGGCGAWLPPRCPQTPWLPAALKPRSRAVSDVTLLVMLVDAHDEAIPPGDITTNITQHGLVLSNMTVWLSQMRRTSGAGL